MKNTIWELNARVAESVYGVQVDWEEGFYVCPECGEPVYNEDWTDEDLSNEFCPICGFVDE